LVRTLKIKVTSREPHIGHLRRVSKREAVLAGFDHLLAVLFCAVAGFDFGSLIRSARCPTDAWLIKE
jgi:hypothetical protein